MGQDTSELEPQDEPQLADDELTDEAVSEVAGGMWGDAQTQDVLEDAEALMTNLDSRKTAGTPERRFTTRRLGATLLGMTPHEDKSP